MLLESDGFESTRDEIKKLTSERAIRDSVHQVDSSKVYVDVTGISKSLDRDFAEVFDRFLQWKSIERENRMSLMTFDIVGKKITKTNVVHYDAAFELFKSLFGILRDKYISSEKFGLDSYLSLRVRHGTLAGQLRRLFENRKLITTVDTKTGQYHRNEHWHSLTTGGNGEILNNLLADFSGKVDEIIEDAKTEWLQIKTDEKRDGLFDFDFSEDELTSMFADSIKLNEYEEFIDFSLEHLKQRAEEVLSLVREKITTELRHLFIDAISELEHSSETQLVAVDLSDFKASLGQCRTEIQQELDLVAGWFESVGEVQMPDFELVHAVNTCVEMLSRVSPELETHTDITESCKWKLPGGFFVHLVDLLFLPMENAIKYSKPGSTVSISIGENEDLACITISNEAKETDDVRHLKLLSTDLETRISSTDTHQAVLREGGSGYYKLGRLVHVNLKPLCIETKIDVSESPLTFQVLFKFKANRE